MFGIPILSDILNIGGGIIGAVGIAYGLWRGKKLQNLIREIFEDVAKYRAIKDAKSKGGVEITPEELTELLDEIQQTAQAAVSVWTWWKARK